MKKLSAAQAAIRTQLFEASERLTVSMRACRKAGVAPDYRGDLTLLTPAQAASVVACREAGEQHATVSRTYAAEVGVLPRRCVPGQTFLGVAKGPGEGLQPEVAIVTVLILIGVMVVSMILFDHHYAARHGASLMGAGLAAAVSKA